MATVDTEAQCSEETIASYFRMIDFYKAEIKAQEGKLQQLLAMLAMEAGKTFRYKGQFYQVCKRNTEGTYFFKLLDKPPKDWLGRKARSARRCRLETPEIAGPEGSVNSVDVQESGTCTPSTVSLSAEALLAGAVAAVATE